jgi:hypothetical protein
MHIDPVDRAAGDAPAAEFTRSPPLPSSVDARVEGTSLRTRDVGADQVRVEPDGTAVRLIIGHVPFGFTGVVKIDVETGERSSSHSTASKEIARRLAQRSPGAARATRAPQSK